MIAEYIKNRDLYGEQDNTNSYISKESIVHQFLVFFFVGMDSTGNLTGIMIYWLAKRKDIFESVENEINQVFGIPDNTNQSFDINDE